MDEQDATRAVPHLGGVPPRPGDRIGTIVAGKYRIMGLLGGGAQGSVYVGEHLKIGRRDAIKVLRPELLEDAEAVARFERGARNASRISHPNVCTVYDAGDTEDGVPFMASELVDGRELQDIMEEEGPFSLERAVDLVEQIAAGLEAAHELDIIHRDLKPANVMIRRSRDGREEVKVVDFDISKGVDESEVSGLTKVGWVVGTPRYMSPEQLIAGDLDGRSDIYSLGLILFELLTGALPHDVGSNHRLMWARAHDERRTLEEIRPEGRFPPGLQGLLDAALSADRDRRPATAREFARRMRAIVPQATGPEPVSESERAASDATIVVSSDPEDLRAPEGPPTQVDPRSDARPPSTAGRVRKSSALLGVGVGAVAALLVGASLSLGTSERESSPALVVPDPIRIEAGEARPLDVRLVDVETGQAMAGQIEYTSMDPSVAAVNEAGVLHGVLVGSTAVIVRAAGLTRQIDVTVTRPPDGAVGENGPEPIDRETTPADAGLEAVSPRARDAGGATPESSSDVAGDAAGDETRERVSRPALAATEIELGDWTVAEEREGPAVRISTRFGLESRASVDWCLAIRYQHGGNFIRSIDAASSVGGAAAAHHTLRSRSGRHTGEETLSIAIDHLEIPLDHLNARVQFDALLAVWPKQCADVKADEAPLAESATPARICLIRSAAGISVDPICRR